MRKMLILFIYLFIMLCGCNCNGNIIQVYCINGLDNNCNVIEISEEELKDFNPPEVENDEYYIDGWYCDNQFTKSIDSVALTDYVNNNKLYLYAKIYPIKYKDYYHKTIESELLFNEYWFNDFKEVSQLLNGSFWYQDNGEYIPYVVKSLPIALGDNSNGVSNTFLIELRNDFQLYYNTFSEINYIAGFKGKPVRREDYLTAWKVYYNQSNGLLTWNDEIDNHIEGLKDFYNATKNGYSYTAWSNVDVKIVSRDSITYLKVVFEKPCDSNYVIEYLSSNIYSPISAEFLHVIGGEKNYCKNIDNKNVMIFDTMLFIGPYVPVIYNKDEVVIEKNPLYNLELEFDYPGIYIDLI